MTDKDHSAPAARLLIVEDDRPQADAVAEALTRAGYACVVVTEPRRALEIMEDDSFDLIITDLVMHEVGGLQILQAARRLDPAAEVIVITGHATIETAVQAIRQGASDYITKPLNLAELRDRVAKALEHRRLVRRTEQLSEQLQERFGFEGIIGQSESMRRIIQTLRQIAPTDATVLIEGESGTGKELIAKALHNNSPRRSRNFVALNCAALSEGILESELFGHEKGAFTGALSTRKGRFEHADGGTLFLDEVGDMPMATQIKLLRVIENREIVRVGSNEPRRVDVRLVSATNQKLEELVKSGRFREDLYFRLKVVRVILPPLRDRREDIPLLTEHYIRRLAAEHSKNVTGITPEAQRVLSRLRMAGQRARTHQHPGDDDRSGPGAGAGCGRRAAGDSPGGNRATGRRHPSRHEPLGGRAAAHRADAGLVRRQPPPGRQGPRHRPADAVPEDQAVRPGQGR